MRVAVIMGSKSDMRIMLDTVDVLESFGVDYDVCVVSAHRTPRFMFDFCQDSESKYDVIVAGAGGSAHLPGMVAAMTLVPVIGVPISLKNLDGMDSLLSIVQMPGGVPVFTVAIDGGKNAGLGAIRILAVSDKVLSDKLKLYYEELSAEVLNG